MRPSALVGRRSVPAAGAGLAGAGALASLGAGSAAHPAVRPGAATPAHRGRATTVVTVTARPAAEPERLRLGQPLRGSEFTSTGLYMAPGATLSVTVGPHDVSLPTPRVGARDHCGEITQPRSHPLAADTRTVTDLHGGPRPLTRAGQGERATVAFGRDAVPITMPMPMPMPHPGGLT